MDVRRLVVVVATVLAAGCGQQAAAPLSDPSTASGTASPSLAHPCRVADEPSQYAPKDDSSLRRETSFVPTQAYICSDVQRDYGKDGTWQVLLAQRLLGDLAALTAALRQPDGPPPSTAGVTYACAASLTIYPTLILVSAGGKQIRPRAPVDYCGDHLPAVDQAVAALRHVTVDQVKLRQLQSAERIALDAAATAIGCSPTWKDGFTHGMVPDTLSKGGPVLGAPRLVSLCRYTANPPEQLEVNYVSGRRLSAGETARLFAAVTVPGKPGGCSRGHDGILLAFAAGAEPMLEIELGGCSRVIRSDGGRTVIGATKAAVIAGLSPH